VIDLSRPAVINLALTGMVPRKADNPAVPISPEEIAADALQSHHAGARIFHVHARHPNEEPAFERELFFDIATRIRAAVPGAILCFTTSGRLFKSFEQRSDSLIPDGPAKPDLASLTLGSLNFPTQASVNEPSTIQRLAALMHERGIVPELEIFDFGMIDYAHYLISRGVLKPPFVCNLLLGSLGTSAATGHNLALMAERLPAGSSWFAAGIGRFQFSMNALGLALGGHVRTGLEDNLFLDPAKTQPASNLSLVTRAANVAQALGRPIPSIAETRRLLGLPGCDSSC
jgi:3-keto-5-aminohexanoate cleavage enzyme